MDVARLRSFLIETDTDYLAIHKQHQALEARLEHIHTRDYVDAAEAVESRTLKKKKLRLKDRMELMARDRAAGSTSPPR